MEFREEDMTPDSRTMAEIEWDDAEHHFAEVGVAIEKLGGNISNTVIMLGVNRFGSISALDTSTRGAWALSRDILTPTGRKDRLILDRDVPEGDPIEVAGDDHASHLASCAEMDDDEPEFDPAYTYRDKDGETWEHLDGKWVQGDSRMDRLVSRNVNHGLNNLLPKFGPYTRIEKENE